MRVNELTQVARYSASGKLFCRQVTRQLISSISQQLETLKKVMDSAHEAQIKEVTARHEK